MSLTERGEESGHGALIALKQQLTPVVVAGDQCIEVSPVFSELFASGGLPRGAQIRVEGTAAVTTCMSVLARASSTGSWIAVVGMESWGWAAAVSAGIDPSRSVSVATPAPQQWSAVLAALVDAVDIVVCDPRHQVSAADVRRLCARCRERGSIIVELTPSDGQRRSRWPNTPDIVLEAHTTGWTGIGDGFGRLTGRECVISTQGRRALAQRRQIAVKFAEDMSVEALPNRHEVLPALQVV